MLKSEEQKPKKRSYQMDMCSGPILKKILIYSLPLMASGILQLLFNAALSWWAGSQGTIRWRQWDPHLP